MIRREDTCILRSMGKKPLGGVLSYVEDSELNIVPYGVMGRCAWFLEYSPPPFFLYNNNCTLLLPFICPVQQLRTVKHQWHGILGRQASFSGIAKVGRAAPCVKIHEQGQDQGWGVEGEREAEWSVKRRAASPHLYIPGTKGEGHVIPELPCT